jgi:hypothetical protein
MGFTTSAVVVSAELALLKNCNFLLSFATKSIPRNSRLKNKPNEKM